MMKWGIHESFLLKEVLWLKIKLSRPTGRSMATSFIYQTWNLLFLWLVKSLQKHHYPSQVRWMIKVQLKLSSLSVSIHIQFQVTHWPCFIFHGREKLSLLMMNIVINPEIWILYSVFLKTLIYNFFRMFWNYLHQIIMIRECFLFD